MAGEKMVVELVGAFNELTERMKVLSSNLLRLLFKSLKVFRHGELNGDHSFIVQSATILSNYACDFEAGAEAMLEAGAFLSLFRFVSNLDEKMVSVEDDDLAGLEDVSSEGEDDNYKADLTDGDTSMELHLGEGLTRKDLTLITWNHIL